MFLLIEVGFIIVVIAIVVSQVLIPLAYGRPTFPLFRREQFLHLVKSEADEALRAAQLERELQAIHEKTQTTTTTKRDQ